MMLQDCPHEKEIRELIASGQWPLAAPPELLAHLNSCRPCSDLALVAEAFRHARTEALAAARLTSPGVLLWRAQLRRRNAAVERLTRPLLGAQIFALAVTLLAGLGFAAFEARHGVAWLTWLDQLPPAATLHWNTLFSASSGGTWLLLFPALAALVLLGGLVVYLATDRQ